MVGLLPLAAYEAQSLILEPGDLLVAYTADYEEWGEDRMLAAVTCRPNAPAAEVLEGIFRAADEVTAGAEQHDDMTLLVMKLIRGTTR